MALKAIESATAVIGNVHLVYDKDEADKVFAEKDKEIAELQKQVHDYAQGLYVIQARTEKEHRKQKRKRCLAMAKQCRASSLLWEGYVKEWWWKWENRWLELAEKFKE